MRRSEKAVVALVTLGVLGLLGWWFVTDWLDEPEPDRAPGEATAGREGPPPDGPAAVGHEVGDGTEVGEGTEVGDGYPEASFWPDSRAVPGTFPATAVARTTTGNDVGRLGGTRLDATTPPALDFEPHAHLRFDSLALHPREDVSLSIGPIEQVSEGELDVEGGAELFAGAIAQQLDASCGAILETVEGEGTEGGGSDVRFPIPTVEGRIWFYSFPVRDASRKVLEVGSCFAGELTVAGQPHRFDVRRTVPKEGRLSDCIRRTREQVLSEAVASVFELPALEEALLRSALSRLAGRARVEGEADGTGHAANGSIEVCDPATAVSKCAPSGGEGSAKVELHYRLTPPGGRQALRLLKELDARGISVEYVPERSSPSEAVLAWLAAADGP